MTSARFRTSGAGGGFSVKSLAAHTGCRMEGFHGSASARVYNRLHEIPAIVLGCPGTTAHNSLLRPEGPSEADCPSDASRLHLPQQRRHRGFGIRLWPTSSRLTPRLHRYLPRLCDRTGSQHFSTFKQKLWRTLEPLETSRSPWSSRATWPAPDSRHVPDAPVRPLYCERAVAISREATCVTQLERLSPRHCAVKQH